MSARDAPRRPARPEERERDNSDAVAATACTRAGRDHDPVEDAVAELVVEPVEMFDVIAGDVPRELHLYRHDAAVSTLRIESFRPASRRRRQE